MYHKRIMLSNVKAKEDCRLYVNTLPSRSLQLPRVLCVLINITGASRECLACLGPFAGQ